jgi:predicted alpha/beta-fold hydrolase
VHLSGRLARSDPSGRILVVVHGLGGSHASFYAVRAAHAARRAGLDCLRLNLRGADRTGGDYYHAGLTADLRAALASEALAGYGEILLLGYSLGGHLVLRYATEDPDPRVLAAAAVCAPVDLSGCCAAIDRPSLWVYRTYLLDGLKRIYARVAERQPVPITAAQARRITTIRGWDDAIVAPRHGFASAEDYYAKASVGPRLRDLKVPALLVSAAHDPMVPWDTVRRWVVPPPPRLTVKRVDDGGHVGFPGKLDLGEDAEAGLEPQILAWLGRWSAG